MSVIWYMLVFLGPLLPAYLVFIVIGPSKINSNVSSVTGTLSGIKFKIRGAFGAYIIICGFSLVVFELVKDGLPVDAREQVEVVLRPLTDEHQDLANYLAKAEGHVTLSLSNETRPPLFLNNLRVDASAGTLAGIIPVFRSELGKLYTVEIASPENRLQLQSQKATLTLHLSLPVAFIPAKREWIAVLDARKAVYSDAEEGFQDLLILRSRYGTSIDTLIFSPFDNFTNVKQVEIIVRRFSPHDWKIWDPRWSRERIKDLDVGEISTEFDRTFHDISTGGDLVGRIIKSFEGGSEKQSAEGTGVQLTGITPHIGPMELPIKDDSLLVVFLTITQLGKPATTIATEEWFGHRFSFGAEHSLILIDAGSRRVDPSMVSMTYRRPSGPIDLTSAGVMRKISPSLFLMDAGMSERDDYMRVAWSWTSTQRR
jgi:hypothetical protein